jgi:nitroreductase
MTLAEATSRPREEALERRYGAATPHAIAGIGPWNDVLDCLLAHRSVRGYRPDPLPAGTLETLVAAAQSAATSSNMQLWSVIATTDPTKKAELAVIAGNQKHIEQCPLFLLWVADLSRHERLGTAEGVEMPTLPYVETLMVAAIDAALAAQNAVVAAESLGLSTVYIGAMRNNPVRVAEIFGLPDKVFGVFGLCVGYAAAGKEGEVKPRLPQEAVLFHERYGVSDETAIRAAYDRELAAFSRRQEMTDATWTSRVLSRMGRMAGMNGRENMRAWLAKLGFPLE